MNPHDEELTGTPDEVTEMVLALNELRDVLNGVSLFLKDILANQDLAVRGEVSQHAVTLIQNLFAQAMPKPQANSPAKAEPTSSAGGPCA